jgi:hypothetical protein
VQYSNVRDDIDNTVHAEASKRGAEPSSGAQGGTLGNPPFELLPAQQKRSRPKAGRKRQNDAPGMLSQKARKKSSGSSANPNKDEAMRFAHNPALSFPARIDEALAVNKQLAVRLQNLLQQVGSIDDGYCLIPRECLSNSRTSLPPEMRHSPLL